MNDRITSVERSSTRPDHARPNSVTVIEASARQEPVNPWSTFALVAVGTFMIMLDASIVNISLPSLGRLWRCQLAGAADSRARLPRPGWRAPVLDQRRDYHRHLLC